MSKLNPQAKFQRTLTLLRLLNSDTKGISLIGLMKELNISERTVYRYIRSLKDIGIFVEKHYILGKVYYRINRYEHNELIEFLPEQLSIYNNTITPKRTKQNKRPVWTYKDLKLDKIFVFDTIESLLDIFPISKDKNKLYSKLRNSDIYITDTFHIERCIFYTKDKMKKTGSVNL